MSRNMGVDQDVLQPFGRLEAERSHPVAGPPGGDDERELDEVAIEVTDPVAGLERSGIAGAGRDHKARRRRRGFRGARGRLAATKCLYLEETGVGNQPAD